MPTCIVRKAIWETPGIGTARQLSKSRPIASKRSGRESSVNFLDPPDCRTTINAELAELAELAEQIGSACSAVSALIVELPLHELVQHRIDRVGDVDLAARRHRHVVSLAEFSESLENAFDLKDQIVFHKRESH